MRALAGILIVGLVVLLAWIVTNALERETVAPADSGAALARAKPPAEADAATPTEPRDEAAPASPAAPPATAARAAASAAPTIVVRGRVVDRAFAARGWPERPGVDVRVGMRCDGEVRDVRTDESGAFRFEVPDTGERPLSIQVLAYDDERYRAASATETLAQGDAAELAIELARHAWGGLAGRVVDVDGEPLAGARVRIWRSSTERLEATSGADGRFAFADVQGAGWNHVTELGGYALLWATPIERADGGGWKPIEVALAPAAPELVVRAVDANGSGVADVDVALALAPEETPRDERIWGHLRDRWVRADDLHPNWLRVHARSDELGRARFDQAWAGRRLVIYVTTAGRTRRADTHDAGRLAFGQAGPERIVLEPDRRTELVAELRSSIRLFGRIGYPDGRPAEGIRVEVEPAEPRPGEPFTRRVQTDALGTWELELGDVEPGERFLVRARAGHRYRPSPEDHHGARAVTIPDAGELRVDLTLEPVQTIEGRLVDPSGAPVSGYVSARAEPPVHPASAPQTQNSNPHEFSIGGLGPGTYELTAHYSLSFVSARQRFAGIPAGTRDLELVLDEPLDVTVRLHVVAPVAVGRLNVLAAIANDPARAASAPPAATFTVVERSAWPAGACLDCTGSMPSEIDGDPFHSFLRQEDGTTIELARLPRDTLAFGVDATDADGRPFAPILSRAARYTTGTYELELRLRRGARLTGRVLDHDPARNLFVAVVDGDGRLALAGDGEHRGASTTALRADGTFALHRLPAGRARVRLGLEPDLRAGRCLIERAIELDPDRENTIELRVP